PGPDMSVECAPAPWDTGSVARQIIRPRDVGRYDGRGLQRLEVDELGVVVVVHEHGPPRGPDDGLARTQRWEQWMAQLTSPTLTDDRGTVYSTTRHHALADHDAPRTDHLPMKATVAWTYAPRPDPAVRAWIVDGRWTLLRA